MLSCINYLDLNPNDQGDGHMYDIIHDNVPLFSTECILTWQTLLTKKSFQCFYFLFSKCNFFKQLQKV
jgi:hypothetical protein